MYGELNIARRRLPKLEVSKSCAGSVTVDKSRFHQLRPQKSHGPSDFWVDTSRHASEKHMASPQRAFGTTIGHGRGGGVRWQRDWNMRTFASATWTR